MGIIRDVIGSALGADQPKNGFRNNASNSNYDTHRLDRRRRSSSSDESEYRSRYSQYTSPPPDQQYSSFGREQPPRRSPDYNTNNYKNNYGYDDNRDPYQKQDYGMSNNREMYSNPGYHQDMSAPPPYSAYPGGGPSPPQGAYSNNNNGYNMYNNGYNTGYDGGNYSREVPNNYNINNNNHFFRPLALPQISFGDGQPFLRGYSNELQQYNISFDDFMRTLDAINVAIIPNPEHQIFQKGANIAGFFVPGAASIGLMAGQLGVGIGAAVGHSASLGKVLSKANLDIFVPNGLEICICKAKDVNNEIGISSNSSSSSRQEHGAHPEDRIASYGNRIAPLSTVLPPLQNHSGGRSDPIAKFGQAISNRDNDRSMRRAERRMQKGKTRRFDALEGGLKWVMVRRATPVALDHWRQMLQKSDAALRQEQGQQDRKGGMA